MHCRVPMHASYDTSKGGKAFLCKLMARGVQFMFPTTFLLGLVTQKNVLYFHFLFHLMSFCAIFIFIASISKVK